MAYDSEAMAIGVCWGLTGLAILFILLRIYTRFHYVSVYGLDDLSYFVALVS